MAQLFSRSANQIARISLAAVALGVGALIWVGAAFNNSYYVTRVNDAVDQPVPFSHKHHVGGLGVDCRYCHNTVEVSSFAGIPPTETCIGCHSQIWADSPMLEPVRASWRTGKPLEWIRVHDLPGFVYFNHSIHINKGIGCESCHGRVDQMPLMRKVATLQMQWCLDCHRNPERHVRPREEVFAMGYRAANQEELGRRLVKEYQIRRLDDCYTCHR